MIEKIFILHHTHVDIGYTGDREKVCNDLVGMVERTMELVEASAERPEGERFRWIHEVSWPVLEYVRRGGARREDLFEQIRGGSVELTALYVNPTDLFDRNSFEVSVEYACQLARRNSLPLTTAMFCDCPGIAWSIVDILTQRGVQYLSTAPNVIMSCPLEVERPFYWEGPEGGRILTWFADWRNGWYSEGLSLKLHEDPEDATGRLLDYVAQLNEEGYRWKGLAIHVALDNGPPLPQLTEFVAHFNANQPDIQASMATNRSFFEFMEAHHSSEFAVHRGAWPDWWSDGIAAAAYETACSRKAKASLRRSSALAQQLGTDSHPELFHQVMEDMLMFDEHTWGHVCARATPWSHLARMEWAKKRIYALKALEGSYQLEEMISQGLGDGYVLANPFEIPFSGICRLRSEPQGAKAPALKDIDTGEHVIGQRLRESNTAGQAGDYYTTHVNPKATRHFRQVKPAGHDTGIPLGLESDHFLFGYDQETGAITSVWDKLLRRQICDKSAKWSFAELIHERVTRGNRNAIYDPGKGFENPEAKRPRPNFTRKGGHTSRRRSKLVTGPVFNSLLTFGSLPGQRFAREIRLYHALRRIDVLLKLDKQIVTDYESLYLAFPFAAKAPEVRVEHAGAVYRAGVDQLPGSAADWHSLGDYVAVSDGSEDALLVVPHGAPVIQISDINTGKWATKLDISSGHIYSWVMNNLWFVNWPAYQEGVVRLAWSLTSIPGSFHQEAAKAFAHNVYTGITLNQVRG